MYEQNIDRPKELQRISELLRFLENRANALDVLGSKPQIVQKRSSNMSAFEPKTSFKCIMCINSDHPTSDCEIFKKLLPEQRWSEVRKKLICINCLNKGHSAFRCRFRGQCSKCFRRHHTLLHDDDFKNKYQKATVNSDETKSETKKLPSSEQVSTNNAVIKGKEGEKQVILATASIYVANKYGEMIKCRALLDSGSQVSFITSELHKKLGLSVENRELIISGVGGIERKSYEQTSLQLKSTNQQYETILEAFILPKITNQQPTTRFPRLNISNNIKLADINYNIPGKIDILIGAELYSDLIVMEKIELGQKLPSLFNTKLGWIVIGTLANDNKGNYPFSGVVDIGGEVVGIGEKSLNQQIELFLNYEGIVSQSNTRVFSPEEEITDKFYEKTTKRDENGR